MLGFAALSGSDDQIQALARGKRAAKGCDLLMANPIDRNGQGFGAAMNGGWLVKTDGSTEEVPVMDKLALAHRLLDQLVDCF